MLDEPKALLQPMTLSKILDKTFKIYGSNFAAIMVFSALIGGILTFLGGLITQTILPIRLFTSEWMGIFREPEINSNMILDFFRGMLPTFFIFQGIHSLIIFIDSIFIAPFVQGGIISLSYREIIGQRLDTRESVRDSWKKFWNFVLTGLALIPYYLGIGIILIIASIIILIPTGIMGILMAANGATVWTVVPFVFFLITAILLIALISMAVGPFTVFTYQTAAIEGNYGFKAIGRSFKLVIRKYWRVLGINFLISLFLALAIGILSSMGGIFALISPLSAIINVFSGFIARVFVTPLAYIAGTLLFIDVRARVEGTKQVGEHNGDFLPESEV
ncbi:MAG: hypothetical protein GX352_02320 [Clostridiales bacterium]|nr:hypothetical protein [Clostridiales bacterium]